jgi:hypothetical protein
MFTPPYAGVPLGPYFGTGDGGRDLETFTIPLALWFCGEGAGIDGWEEFAVRIAREIWRMNAMLEDGPAVVSIIHPQIWLRWLSALTKIATVLLIGELHDSHSIYGILRDVDLTHLGRVLIRGTMTSRSCQPFVVCHRYCLTVCTIIASAAAQSYCAEGAVAMLL